MFSAPGRSRAFLLGFVLLCAMNGCGARPSGERVVTRSFYYWRGTFALSEPERTALRELDVRRLYLRLFDVAIDKGSGETKPVGITTIAAPAPEGIEIVPTVFITVDVVRSLGPDGIKGLARKIVGKVRSMLPALGGSTVEELQIDCDWTGETRGSYFALLEGIEREIESSGWLLSATVRLHQLRDRHTSGIPPVERGMLMVYNTGNPADPTVRNAIFDAADIKGYLKSLGSYPLPLDVALPLFSWGVVFHEGSFFVLLNNLAEESLHRPEIEALGDGWYRLDGDIYIDGIHLFAGDRIRFEEADRKETLAVAELISRELPGDSVHLSLFHLHPSIIDGHDRTDLSALYSALR
jgi:hypothetical protein